MKAIDFIKNNGVDKAREVVDGAPEGATHIRDSYGYVAYLKAGVRKERYHENTWLMALVWKPDYLLSELKRLVESVDLVNCNGGWNGTKNTITLFQSSLDLGLYHGVDGVDAEVEIPRLKQAIADYKQLFGNTETLELETLRDCDTSPNCKKFDERVGNNETN